MENENVQYSHCFAFTVEGMKMQVILCLLMYKDENNNYGFGGNYNILNILNL